jgi:hypothetical protein
MPVTKAKRATFLKSPTPLSRVVVRNAVYRRCSMASLICRYWTTSPRLPFRGLLGPPEGAEAHTLAIGPLAARQKGTLHPLLSANCDVACTAYCRLL